MTPRSPSDFDFDRTIDAWLALGPTELSDRVAESARLQVHLARRRAVWRRPSRPSITFSRRLVAGLGSAVLIVAVVSLGLRLAAVPPNGARPSPSPSRFASPGPPSEVFQATGRMTAGRLYHTATLLRDGRVLVAGGSRFVADAAPDPYAGNPLLASAELYDPATGTFTATGSMTAPRSHHTATLLLDGRVLIAGGGNSGMYARDGYPFGQPFALATAELYDPATGAFAATGSMASERFDASAIRLADGRVLIVGGVTPIADQPAGAGTRSAELYDPVSGTFSPTGSISGARFWAPVLLADGRVVGLGAPDVTGGGAWIETYDQATGTFSVGASLPTGFYATTRLADGRVLLLGADDDGTGQTSTRLVAQLYDPATGTLNPTGTPGINFKAYTATTLADGRVLLIGFTAPADAGLPLLSFVYDPAAGTFSATQPPAYSWQYQTSTLLLDGRVLTVGGGPNMPQRPAFATAELFR